MPSDSSEAVRDGQDTEDAHIAPDGTFRFLCQDPRPFTYMLEGWPFPPKCRVAASWEAHIAALLRLPLRDDDIFVVAYPKAGTHWLWEVISMLVQGKAEYDVRPKEHLMFELTELDKLADMPSPRILNTHLPFVMLPCQQMREKRTKVVYVYRNPKDSCVSLYHHLQSGEDSMVKDMNFEQFSDIFFYEDCWFGSYFRHMKEVFSFISKNVDLPVLSVSFEDMKKVSLLLPDMVFTIPTNYNLSSRRNALATEIFLGVDVSDALCEDIAEACSFNNLKKGAELKNPIRPPDKTESREKTRKYTTFYRKGEIGDWKNYFTVAMSEKTDAVIREKMDGLPYSLQYS